MKPAQRNKVKPKIFPLHARGQTQKQPSRGVTKQKVFGKSQPYHQRLREYRFYVNIGRGVKIGCDRCFYITDVLHYAFNIKLIAFNN